MHKSKGFIRTNTERLPWAKGMFISVYNGIPQTPRTPDIKRAVKEADKIISKLLSMD